MNLIQDLQNYTFYLGWYGTCDTVCEPFDLNNYKQEIHAIYQFSSSGLATSSFVADAPSWLSSFSQLECGKIYYIVMKPGSNSIDIPHLRVSAYDSSDSGARVIESCDYFNGSPYDSTPTPKFCYETSCDYDAFTHAFYLGKFREKQINNYKFNFNWGCFCPPDYSREVTIFVKDNLITKIIDTNTNEIVINGEVATYYTLENLFNYISEAKEIHNAEEISVKYDYEYNFISSGYIDYIKEAVDDEMGFSVRDFEIIYDYTPTPTPNDFSPTDPTPTSQIANFDSLISEYENLTSDDPNRVNLEIRGEISYIELEGGFFGVIDSFGKQYIPINLQGALSGSNNKFLKVIRGFAKKDQISIFMWGTLIYCEDWEVQEPPIGCPEDLRICDDGTYLSRDPKLDCNFPPCTFDVNKFNASYKNWDLSNISSYSFDFAWSCFCTDEYTKNVRIYVENNKLIKIIDKLTGAEVLNNEIATYFTMTELYEYVKTAYLKNPYKITISFDDNYNIITNLFIDYEPNIADEEMGFFITDFSIDEEQVVFSPENSFLKYSGDEADRESREVIGGDDGATSLYCRVSAEIENIDNENKLVVRSNGVPNYTPKVGDTTIVGSWQDELSVSTDGNPNTIGEQDYVFKIPLTDVTINPVQSDDDDYYNVVNTGLGPIGISSNGVPLFNPWHNNQNDYLSASRDAMTFATFSSCCGHPSGAEPGRTGAGPYHYHKYPTCIAGNRGLSPTSDIIEEEDMADVIDEKLKKTGSYAHSPILGYMLDGYPVYGPVGTTNTTFNEKTSCKILRSSYVLNGENYEYIKGSGDLDKCNAIYSATPEYPNGCYHYVLSIDSNEDGTVKRTENPLYIHRDTGTDEIKYIITPMYPYTTIYYRGSNFGSFTNGDGSTSIDPNDDPCAGYMVTWGPGIAPKPEDCYQDPPPDDPCAGYGVTWGPGIAPPPDGCG